MMTATFSSPLVAFAISTVHWLRGMNDLRLLLGFVPARIKWFDGLIVMLISAANRFLFVNELRSRAYGH